MCGIVGFIGNEQAAPILLDGLERLEYRGYDSAGVSVYSDGELKVVKALGRLSVLKEMIDGGKSLNGTCGIGHTRWATHGQPSDENSHPHMSGGGKIAVVHNGIIENYVQLKEMLSHHGVKFASETDSEVVAHLIKYYYELNQGNLLDAVYTAIDRIEGSYALGIMSLDNPDQIIAVRKDNPLILAKSEKGCFLASDVTAILKHTRDVIYLEDGQFAVVGRDDITVYNEYREKLDTEFTRIDWEVSAAEKGGYEHFMFKEMMEQPEVFRKAITPRIKNGRIDLSEVSITEEFLKNVGKIYVIACGSAYHTGVVAKYVIEKLVRKRVEAVLASEFRYSDPIIDEGDLVLVISQSGETADTLAAMREAKRLGARTLAIVNVVGSTIAKEADDVIYTWAGPEIAVATTKAYSAQLAVIYLLTLYLADLLGMVSDSEYKEIVNELQMIPDKIQRILDQTEILQYFASIYFNNHSIFFIGRNLDYAVCLEGSLKLKEISYIHSEAYAAGELKHGTISLIEDGTLVVALASYQKLFEKLMSNVQEVKARGASVMCVAMEDCIEKVLNVCDSTFVIPKCHPMLMPSLEVIPLQLFAYYVALFRGCDIDKPRNLAKSVTVE